MAAVLLANVKGADVRAYQLVDAAVNQLGGVLDRETAYADGSQQNPANLIGKIFARCFFWFGDRIYQFNGSAFYIPVSGESGSFYTFQRGDSWTSSGTASGTFLEDGVAADGFVKVLISSGTFLNGDTVVHGVESATGDANAIQRGAVGSEGEWGVRHVLASSVDNVYGHSGFHSLNINNEEGAAGVYRTTGNTYRGWTYDPDTDQFTDTVDFGAITGAQDAFASMSAVIGQAVVWAIGSGTANRYATLAFNPSTVSVSFAQTPGAVMNLNADQLSHGGYLPAVFKNRIFSVIPSNNAGDARVMEQTGGWAAIHLLNGATSGAGIPDFGPSSAAQGAFGCTLFEHGGKLWAMVRGDLNTTGSVGVFILAFTDVNGTLVCDNMELDGGTLLAADDLESLSTFLLPGTTIPPVQVGGTNITDNAKIRVVRDEQANDPDNQDNIIIYFIRDSLTGDADVLTWGDPFPTLTGGLTIDWSTVAEVAAPTYRVDTNQDPTGDLAVNDWIRDPDGKIFRVSLLDTVAPFGVEFENPAGVSIQTVGTSNVKLAAPVSTGVAVGVGEFAFSDNNLGGGVRFFTKNEKGFLFTGFTGLPATEQIRFKCEGGGTVDIDLFHGEGDVPMDTQTPLTNLSGGGSLVGDQIQSFPADGTEGTVEHTGVNEVVYRRGAKLS